MTRDQAEREFDFVLRPIKHEIASEYLSKNPNATVREVAEAAQCSHGYARRLIKAASVPLEALAISWAHSEPRQQLNTGE